MGSPLAQFAYACTRWWVGSLDLLDKLVAFYGVRVLRECGVVIDKLLDVVGCCGDSVVVFRCVLFVSTFLFAHSTHNPTYLASVS